MGFDQICLYNLVLAPEFDVPWAHDPSLVGRMSGNEAAFEQWLAARAFLLDRGFEQTTLTNFERGERRFVYERASFAPATWDAIGFGPAAISTFTANGRAVKWMNARSSGEYLSEVGRTAFEYAPRDLQLLHVTRNLSALRVDVGAYRRFFGTRFEDDFAVPLDALVHGGLLDGSQALTERGMFFADAVAGHFASARVAMLREAEPSVPREHMG